MRSCAPTRSTSVTSSVTVCSTWMRGFISMNTCWPARSPAVSTRNSTVPALTYPISLAKATASRCRACRISSSRFGAGAISMTFWWRRWSEQSRSKRCTTLPSPSARICTSMCRGRRTACSRNTVGSPKAVSASRIAASREPRRSSRRSTRRMPRPPPPATALTKMGKPISSACSRSHSTSALGSEEARVGMPARLAARRASTLLPVSSRTSAGGPTKVIPFSAAARARPAFSDRKP